MVRVGIVVEVEEFDGHAERFELRKVDDDDIDGDALSERALVDSTTRSKPID